MGNVGHYCRLESQAKLEEKLRYLLDELDPDHRGYRIPKRLLAYGPTTPETFVADCIERQEQLHKQKCFNTGKQVKTLAWWWMPRFADGVVLSKKERQEVEKAVLPILADDTIAVFEWHIPKKSGKRQKGPDLNIVVSAVTGRGVLLRPTRDRVVSIWGELADALNAVIAALNVQRKKSGQSLIPTMEGAKAKRRQQSGPLKLREQLAQFPECTASNESLITVLETLGYEVVPTASGKAHRIRVFFHPALSVPERTSGFGGGGYSFRLDELRQEVANEIDRRTHRARNITRARPQTKVPAPASNNNPPAKQPPSPPVTPAPAELSSTKSPAGPAAKPDIVDVKKPETPIRASKKISNEEAWNFLANQIRAKDRPFTSIQEAVERLERAGCRIKQVNGEMAELELPIGTSTVNLMQTLLQLQRVMVRLQLRTDKRADRFPEICLQELGAKQSRSEVSKVVDSLSPLSPRWLVLWEKMSSHEYRNQWFDALGKAGGPTEPVTVRAVSLAKTLQKNGFQKQECVDLILAHIRTDLRSIPPLLSHLHKALESIPLPSAEAPPLAKTPLPSDKDATRQGRPVLSPVCAEAPPKPSVGAPKPPSRPPQKLRALYYDEAFDALITKLSDTPPIQSLADLKKCVADMGYKWEGADELQDRLMLEINNHPAVLPLNKTILVLQWAQIQRRANGRLSDDQLISFAPSNRDFHAEQKALHELGPLDACWRELWELMGDEHKQAAWAQVLERTAQTSNPLQRSKDLVKHLRQAGFDQQSAIGLVCAHLEVKAGLPSNLHDFHNQLCEAARVEPSSPPPPPPPPRPPAPPCKPATFTRSSDEGGREVGKKEAAPRKAYQPVIPVTHGVGAPKRWRKPITKAEALQMLISGIPPESRPVVSIADLVALVGRMGWELVATRSDTDELTLRMDDQAITLPLRQTRVMLQLAIARQAADGSLKNSLPRPNFTRATIPGLLSSYTEDEMRLIDAQPGRWVKLWKLLQDPKVRNSWEQALEQIRSKRWGITEAGEIYSSLRSSGMQSSPAMDLLLAHASELECLVTLRAHLKLVELELVAKRDKGRPPTERENPPGQSGPGGWNR